MRSRSLAGPTRCSAGDGLADDLKVEQYRVECCLVSDKTGDTAPRSAAPDLLGRSDQIIQVEQPVT